MRKRSKISTSKKPQPIDLDATRHSAWNTMRRATENWFVALPLPNINPDYVSYSSVVLALLFVFALSEELWGVAWLFLLVHLFLDGVDGGIVRKYGLRKKPEEQLHGQITDIITDRVSEAVIFLWPAFFVPWFSLYVLNVLLAIFTIHYRRALIMPLRQIFFVIYTLSVLFWLR